MVILLLCEEPQTSFWGWSAHTVIDRDRLSVSSVGLFFNRSLRKPAASRP
jgi:hypothetical protein